MACNNKKNIRDNYHYEVENVVVTSEEDHPDPPPPGFTSLFKNMQEWLVNICDNEKPLKTISTFNFCLFESQDEYTVCLTGTNNYELSQNYTTTRIEFLPKAMHYSLPENEYKNMTREKVLETLTLQLKRFTTTEKFKHSFLSGAQSITTSWTGEIWSGE